MGPDGDHKPKGALAEAIDATFGSFDEFKAKFSSCAGTVFGSGWAWLYLDTTSKKLVIAPSFNQDTPANDTTKVPLLTLDVWYVSVLRRVYCQPDSTSFSASGSTRTTSSTTRTALRTSRRSGTW